MASKSDFLEKDVQDPAEDPMDIDPPADTELADDVDTGGDAEKIDTDGNTQDSKETNLEEKDVTITPSSTANTKSKKKSSSKPKATHSTNTAAAAVGAAGLSPDEEESIINQHATQASNAAASSLNASSEVGKPKRGGSKPILKVSGIGRVDNNLRSTTFTSAQQINQKNYYTDYLRRDDQIMFYRDWNDEQRRQKDAKDEAVKEAAKAKVDGAETIEEKEDDDTLPAGSKTIVIHLGSQNLRIGRASDAYPKVSPTVIAHRKPYHEIHATPKIPMPTKEYDELCAQFYEEEAAFEEGKKLKAPPEPDHYLMYGREFKEAHATVYKDFRERMRFYKRRIVPNSHDLVVSFNRRSASKPERIPDLNDPNRIEWVNPELENWPRSITGSDALKILPELVSTNILSSDIQNQEDDDAKPNGQKKHPYLYELKWPIQHGMFNETDYDTAQELLGDISLILINAIEKDLHISFKQYPENNVVLIIPDLYTRSYVDNMVGLLLQMGFCGVAVMQESMAATFGAGVSTACVVDIGAHTTKIACVEEGMIIPDSRVNLKFGGADISLALTKLLLMSSFPFAELNLANAYDFGLIEELKQEHVTTNDADITVQLYNFIKRAPGKPAEKLQFKVFEEVMLAPLGLFYPEMFVQKDKQDRWAYKRKAVLQSAFDDEWEDIEDDQEIKVEPKPLITDLKTREVKEVSARYSLFPKSSDIYDGTPNDPESAAQYAIAQEKLTVYNMPTAPAPVPEAATNGSGGTNGTVTVNGSSATTARSTPVPGSTGTDEASTTETKSSPISGLPIDPLLYKITGLDHAIIESIAQAGLSKLQAAGQLPGLTVGLGTTLAPAANLNSHNAASLLEPATILTNLAEAEKIFYGNLLLVGGAASKLPGFNALLSDRLEMWISHAGKPLPPEIAVMPAPREMDPQVLTWKGGGVFSKLKIASECWVSPRDWDTLGNRSLQYKTLFAY